MTKASQLFSAENRQRISVAVAEAEALTSAEIVPAVASASGRYDRPEDIVGLWLGLVAMAAVWAIYPLEAPEPGSWHDRPAVLQLLALIAALVAGFLVGAVLASRIDWLRRLFTPVEQMREEVLASARQVCFDRRIYRTADATGLLVYISLFERMAAIVADQAVLDKLGQSALDELCAQLTASLRQHPPTEALCQSIAAAGQRLAPVLPRDANDVNELADALIVID